MLPARDRALLGWATVAKQPSLSGLQNSFAPTSLLLPAVRVVRNVVRLSAEVCQDVRQTSDTPLSRPGSRTRSLSQILRTGLVDLATRGRNAGKGEPGRDTQGNTY